MEAVVTRPLFSADHGLLIPEGSRLLGDVLQAQPARRFRRNRKAFFVFRQIKLPAGTVQGIRGYLEGVEADFDAHLALDSEGAARASSPKTRFIFPAVASTLASSIAITGAGFSVYSNFIARGEDVVLPANTPVKISLGAHASTAEKRQSVWLPSSGVTGSIHGQQRVPSR